MMTDDERNVVTNTVPVTPDIVAREREREIERQRQQARVERQRQEARDAITDYVVFFSAAEDGHLDFRFTSRDDPLRARTGANLDRIKQYALQAAGHGSKVRVYRLVETIECKNNRKFGI